MRKKNTYSYKIEKELRSNITRVLFRCYYKYELEFDEETGDRYIRTNCPPDAFKQIVKRAICEKKSKEDKLCYVTWEESKNMFRVADIMRFQNSTSFIILDAKGKWPKWLM